MKKISPNTMKKISPKKLKKKMFNLLGGILLTFLLSFFTIQGNRPIPSGDTPAVFYSSDHDEHLGNVFIDAISSAEKSIQIAVYTLTDQRVIQALRKKAMNGVKVSIVCDAKACQGLGKKLGNDIIYYPSSPKGLMHLKIVIVDEKLVWIGSANLTGESLRLHAIWSWRLLLHLWLNGFQIS